MSIDQSLEAAQRVADRRSFLKSAGVTGLGLASATFAAGKLGAFDQSGIARSLGMAPRKVEAASAITDTDILNFALNLEYLEAEFYTIAVTGKRLNEVGIATSGVGKEGPTTGGAQVTFPGSGAGQVEGQIMAVAEQLMYDEQAHVQDLRSYLGKAAIAKPAINLDALGIGFASVQQFLTLARAFEDVGQSAYSGAAPLISSKEVLATAARILPVEALHAGNIRLLIAQLGIPTTPVDSMDILPPPSGTKYFTVNSQALANARSAGQVLAIVYGTQTHGAMSGGFFPDGVNGVINTV